MLVYQRVLYQDAWSNDVQWIPMAHSKKAAPSRWRRGLSFPSWSQVVKPMASRMTCTTSWHMAAVLIYQRGCYSYSEFHKVQVCPSVSFESLREHQEHPPKSSVHFLCSAVNCWVNVGQSSILRLSWDGDSLHAREKPQLAGSPAHKGWGAYYGAAASESTFRNWKVFPWLPLVYQFSTSCFCEIVGHVGCAPRQRQVPLQQSAPPLAL